MAKTDGVPADFIQSKPVKFEPWKSSDVAQITYVCGNEFQTLLVAESDLMGFDNMFVGEIPLLLGCHR